MSHSFDLRAPSTPQTRFRARAYKYDGFRAVKPGQLGRPHYDVRPPSKTSPFSYDAPISTATPVEIWNKKRLFIEAQQWPRPPTYHHAHQDKKNKRGAKMAYERRRWEGRERRRVLQFARMPDRIWEGQRDGGWRGGVGDGGFRWEGGEEEVETEVEDDEREGREKDTEPEEQVASQLVADAVTARRIKALCELEKDGWSLCDLDDEMSDESSDFEFV